MIIRAKEQGYQYCNSGNCQQDCTTDFMCDQNCKGNCNQNCATGDRCVQSCSIDGNCKQTCHSSACLQRCTKGQKCNMTCQATDHCEQVCCKFVSGLTRFDATLGSITSRCSGNEPALLFSGRKDRTREDGGNRA